MKLAPENSCIWQRELPHFRPCPAQHGRFQPGPYAFCQREPR
jgi:hypothetical protein